jgi:hypothetical protein
MHTPRNTALAALSLLALCAGSTPSDAGPMPVVPDALKVAPPQTLSLAARAIGVQIYDCLPAKGDPLRYEWTFRAPEAQMYDAAGTPIGKHYAGPTWESNDGSQVVGEVRARDDGPVASAIPWLLLRAKSSAGSGVLGRTTSIQRMETAGGTAPGSGCGPAQAGAQVRVPYQATYYFYVAGP